ncbi:MAG: hypothetical protein AVDCRST_MAG19-293, partial [uncultured Thermomicrobiales bacterium]
DRRGGDVRLSQHPRPLRRLVRVGGAGVAGRLSPLAGGADGGTGRRAPARGGHRRLSPAAGGRRCRRSGGGGRGRGGPRAGGAGAAGRRGDDRRRGRGADAAYPCGDRTDLRRRPDRPFPSRQRHTARGRLQRGLPPVPRVDPPAFRHPGFLRRCDDLGGGRILQIRPRDLPTCPHGPRRRCGPLRPRRRLVPVRRGRRSPGGDEDDLAAVGLRPRGRRRPLTGPDHRRARRGRAGHPRAACL